MKKPPAILLNDDFYSKGRNIRWIKENGDSAVLILQCAWIASSKEKKCRIAKEDVIHIPFLSTYPSEKIYQVLDSAVLVGLLEGNATHYWNSQIAENTQNFQSKQKNYSAAALAREAAKRQQDSGRISPESEQNPLNINSKCKGKSKRPVFEMVFDPEKNAQVRRRIA